MAPRVSVVVPVWNNRAMTLDCLDSLRSASSKTNFRLVVVDNGSTDGIDADLAGLAEAGSIRCIRNGTNLGYAKATNQGIRAGLDAEYQLLLNNDTIALDGWLDALVDDLDAHSEADVAGSLLLYPGGDAIQHAGMVAGRSGGELKFLHRWQYRSLARTPEAARSEAVDAVTGASMLVRTSAIERLGALSEEFRNGFEDIDLCARIAKAGRAIRYVAGSRLYHLESRTPGRRAHEEVNASLFQKRWAGEYEDLSSNGFAAQLLEVRLRRRLESDPGDLWALSSLSEIVRWRGDGESEELDARFAAMGASVARRIPARLVARIRAFALGGAPARGR